MVTGLQFLLAGNGLPKGSNSARRVMSRFAVDIDPTKYFLNRYCRVGIDPGTEKPLPRR